MTETTEDEPAGDNASDERLLFGEKREETTLFAGSPLGVTRIDIAAAQVGQFSLMKRGTVRALGTDGTALVVAREDAVSVYSGSEWRSVGFGSATAVGIDDSWLYAADENRIARLDRAGLEDSGETNSEWETVGAVSTPRRFDGNRLATGDGLVQVDSGIEPLGLGDVRDVSGTLAATAEGLYEQTGTEWTRLRAGDVTTVIADGPGYALIEDELFEREGDAFHPVSIPGSSPPVAVAYGTSLAVMTEDGTVHVAADPDETHDGQGGWRSQAVGLRDVVGLVAVTG